jgi:hypothetical protein
LLAVPALVLFLLVGTLCFCVAEQDVGPLLRTEASRIIIGAATDLPLNYCLRFVLSVRAYCPDAAVVLVVYNEDVEKLEILQTDLGVVFVPYSRWAEDMRVVFYRFRVYDQFLRHLSSAGRYDYIMLTDVRDVVFQADPFAGVPADKARRSSLSSSSHDAAQPPPACARLQIIFSTESPTPTLGTCKYNSAAYKVRCASLQ